LKPSRELRSALDAAHRPGPARPARPGGIGIALCAAIALLGCTPQPREDQPATRTAAGAHHIIKPGETIWGIAKLYNVKPIDIVEHNNIRAQDMRKLTVGRSLSIPGVTRAKTDPPAANPRKPERYTGAYERSFIRPVDGSVAAGFGTHTEVGTRSGIDYRAAAGAGVRAAKSGIVLECATIGGWGKTILIDHGSRQRTFYAHLASVEVSPGEKVEQSQIIARVGDTGRVTRPTLHFRIYQDGKPVDPRKRLSF